MTLRFNTRCQSLFDYIRIYILFLTHFITLYVFLNSYFILSYFILSYLISSYFILSYFILSHFILLHFILSSYSTSLFHLVFHSKSMHKKHATIFSYFPLIFKIILRNKNFYLHICLLFIFL